MPVGYYSAVFEIDPLHFTNTTDMINLLRANFSKHRIPQTFISDNMTKFTKKHFFPIFKTMEISTAHTTLNTAISPTARLIQSCI